uniref:Uncharacterized protein n=1 Tax=Hucho hucho TaxID=62062 RepID=A0A4W5LQ45_9TELE
ILQPCHHHSQFFSYILQPCHHHSQFFSYILQTAFYIRTPLAPSEDLKITHHADNSLSSFCKWQKRLNVKGEEHAVHHDVAVLLTSAIRGSTRTLI